MEQSEKKEIYCFNPKIKLLTPEDEHLVNVFNSGDFAFNNYINRTALKDMLTGDGVTYLVENIKENNNSEMIAYYTISAASIINIYKDTYENDSEEEAFVPENLEYLMPISAFMINMFAVNSNYQDCYYNDCLISSLVLKYIIGTLYEMSVNIIGAKGIILCSVPTAVSFYEKNNFQKIDECYTILDKVDALDNIPMYLTLHDIFE